MLVCVQGVLLQVRLPVWVKGLSAHTRRAAAFSVKISQSGNQYNARTVKRASQRQYSQPPRVFVVISQRFLFHYHLSLLPLPPRSEKLKSPYFTNLFCLEEFFPVSQNSRNFLQIGRRLRKNRDFRLANSVNKFVIIIIIYKKCSLNISSPPF